MAGQLIKTIFPKFKRGPQNKNRGVVLLFVMLMLSALLSVSIAIAIITLEQLLITGRAEDSFIALYSTDHGLERALYRDFVQEPLACPTPCTEDSQVIYASGIPSGGCYTTSMDKSTIPGTTKIQIVGQYRCPPASSRVVKRAFEYTYLSIIAGGFNPDTAGTLESGLVAYWPLEEASGTRSDVRGSNHLTDSGTVTSNPGKVDNAGQFVRTDPDYLSIADNADLSTGDIDFTIAVWAYADTSPGGGFNVIASKENQPPNEWTLGWLGSANRFAFRIWNPGDLLLPANLFGIPSINTWYFIVAWHDAAANTINIQVNNGAIDSIGTGNVGPSNTTASFQIGEIGLGTGNGWNGRIDEFGFWKRVLSAQERADLFNDSNADGIGEGNTCTAPCQ